MTNDINTLNGALKEAGETLAANLTTQGVPSTWDEGLTTLIGKVLDITPTPPTPAPASITLTADKSILSYADTESAVLTATVLDSSSNPVEGVSVDLYKDSVLWDTLTTGSAGTVSKTYTSAGVGDVGFTAECGSLVTERYDIEDCTKYFNQEYTTFSPDFTLPSTFKIEYEDYINSSKPSFVYVGETTGKALLCGKIVSSSTQLYIIARNGDSNKVTNCSNCTYNTWISETITYDGTNFEFDNTSVTDLNGVSLTKLVGYDGGGYSKIRNIKIKPL